MIEPEDRWEPWPVDIRMTGGPDRIYDDDPKPEWRAPVGFIWRLEDEPEDEIEPLLWEGDNA